MDYSIKLLIKGLIFRLVYIMKGLIPYYFLDPYAIFYEIVKNNETAKDHFLYKYFIDL